jgi:hypothetical protein
MVDTIYIFSTNAEQRTPATPILARPYVVLPFSASGNIAS